MTNTCNNCIHWRLPDRGTIGGLEVGTCMAVPMLFEATEWIELDDTAYIVDDPDTWQVERRLRGEYTNTLAFVQDASDYSADLHTKAGFYCNMWCCPTQEDIR